MSADWTQALRRAPRAALLTLVGIIATVNMFASFIIGSVQQDGMVIAATNLFGLNAAQLFALYGLWEIGQREPATAGADRFSRADGLVVSAAMVLSLFPWHVMALPAVLGLGIWCFFTSPIGSAERRAGVLMLAIGGSSLAARLLLHSVGDQVVSLDAQFVGWLAGVDVRDNVVDFRSVGQRSFILGMGCSSVHNMSQALLLWATVTQLLRITIDWTLALYAVLAMLGMFLVNAARLTAIAWFPQHFDSIHVGTIASLFSFASLIAAMAIIAVGILHAQRRPA